MVFVKLLSKFYNVNILQSAFIHSDFW